MSRTLIFGIVGPPLGFLVAIVMAGGFSSNGLEIVSLLLPYVMLFGILPAWLTAVFDWRIQLLRFQSLIKYTLIGAVGYSVVCLLMLESVLEVTPLFKFEYRWGLAGAIPAVICSWLTAKASGYGNSGSHLQGTANQ